MVRIMIKTISIGIWKMDIQCAQLKKRHRVYEKVSRTIWPLNYRVYSPSA